MILNVGEMEIEKMGWFAIMEEKVERSEQGPSKINPIIINGLNTLNAPNAKKFIISSLKF
jgi:hypothetical protein